jgi:hypothetical protein
MSLVKPMNPAFVESLQGLDTRRERCKASVFVGDRLSRYTSTTIYLPYTFLVFVVDVHRSFASKNRKIVASLSKRA